MYFSLLTKDLSPEVEVPVGLVAELRFLGTLHVVLGASCPSHQGEKTQGVCWRPPAVVQ